MSEMLSKIYLDSEKYKLYKIDSITPCLDNLSRINIFIGQNNSGKSMLLRSIFADKDFEFELKNINFTKLSALLVKIIYEIKSQFISAGIGDASSPRVPGVLITLSQFQKKANRLNFNNVNNFVSEFNNSWKELLEFRNQSGSGLPNGPHYDLSTADPVVKGVSNKYNSAVKSLVPAEVNYSVDRIYVPILRGLRPTQSHDDKRFSETSDNYLERTQRDYFSNKGVEDKCIFTGLRLYEDTKKMLLGKQEDRFRIRRFEEFIGKVFFNSETISLIPNINDDALHISIGNDERPIYELGDGIQSLIILLYPIFFNQGKKMLFFFEEPENSMHPGLQRLFIETLMRDEFKDFQYFFTTHSNHFLDITMDLSKISVFTFKKIKEVGGSAFKFEIKNTTNEDIQVLDLIGVRNSSLFLSNCTIWVEGITDRLYLKKYLEVYQNALIQKESKTTIFREDFNFSFIEYCGGNIVHCTFNDTITAEDTNWELIKARKISTKIFLIADKDNSQAKPKSAKAQRLAKLSEQLGENFRVIDGVEIENIISPEILIKGILIMEGDNAVNVKFDSKHVTEKKYKNIKMGRFIEQTFQNLTRKYSSKTGTIYPKLEFCRVVISLINDTSDISVEGLKIVEQLYKFIALNNGN